MRLKSSFPSLFSSILLTFSPFLPSTQPDSTIGIEVTVIICEFFVFFSQFFPFLERPGSEKVGDQATSFTFVMLWVLPHQCISLFSCRMGCDVAAL